MKNIWIVGAGEMAIEYIKILEFLKKDYITIGRGNKGVEKCISVSSKPVISGGLDAFLATKAEVPEFAIVAVPSENLASCSESLIKYGVKNILVEKPAGLYDHDIKRLLATCKKFNSNLLIAYNRRFYSSVIAAKKMIEDDGGPTSCHFEFTEWSHVIKDLKKPINVLQNWFLGNSTHVVDLAFYLIGKPKEMKAYTNGGVDWHERASVFTGAGLAGNNVLFSYHANWEAPGRWSVEVLTRKNRYIFKPMEELKVVSLGSVTEINLNIVTSVDKEFKPGLFLEVESFLHKDFSNHCSIEQQAEMVKFYYKMANYD